MRLFSLVPILLVLVPPTSLATALRTLQKDDSAHFPIVCNIIQVDVEFSQQLDGDESYICLADTLDGGYDQAYGIELTQNALEELGVQDLTEPLYIAISAVSLDSSSTTLIVAADAEISVEPPNDRKRQRRLARTQGVNKLLVLRVTHRNNSPSLTSQQLAGSVFGVGGAVVNLASQMRACSFNKLQIVPASGDGIQNGVAEIHIGDQVSGDFSVRKLENLVADKATKFFGGSLSSKFDHVVIVMPSGLKYDGRAYLAYGYLGGIRTVFEDQWAGRISSLAHEVGHNLSLSHAGKGSEKYGDITGYMGFGVGSKSTPLSCFNAQKHWSLGWFHNRHVVLATNSLPWGGNVAAFVDYDKSAADQAVVIKIGSSNPRLFLQYNRAKGHNLQTRELANQVVIVRDEGMTEKTAGLQSWLVAGIMVNHETAKPAYRYSKFDGKSDLVIEVCKQGYGPPDYVQLSVHLDDGKQKSTCGGNDSNSDNGKCKDSSDPFYLAQKDTYKSCTWLSKRFSRWGERACKRKFDAFLKCPKTCGSCCGDSETETFFVKKNLSNKSCKWLSTRERWQKRLCYQGHDAYRHCRETCGRCGRRLSRGAKLNAPQHRKEMKS